MYGCPATVCKLDSPATSHHGLDESMPSNGGAQAAYSMLMLQGPPSLVQTDPLLGWRPPAAEGSAWAQSRRTACPSAHPSAAASASEEGKRRRVEERQASELTYAQFVTEFMEPNRPVLIKGGALGWRAAKEWVAGPRMEPDIGAIEQAAGGDAQVWVTDTSSQGGMGGCAPVIQSPLATYMAWWRDRAGLQQRGGGSTASGSQGQPGQSASTAGPAASAQQGSHHQEQHQRLAGRLPPSRLWYLKDWHFVALRPDYQLYEVPPWFTDDWLNKYYDGLLAAQRGNHVDDDSVMDASLPHEQEEQGEADIDDAPDSNMCSGSTSSQGQGPGQEVAEVADYRFVYLGPAGSWTPLHSDVLRSHSWSANVAGRKSWLLLPPEYTYMCYDADGVMLAPHFGGPCSPGAQMRALAAAGDLPALASADVCDLDEGQFPHLSMARELLYECIQGPGDVLFVPSGWHHVVVNLRDTLSINHNWLNAHNLHWTWALLKAQHTRAAADIEDCRELCGSEEEWHALVARNLKADSGWDLQDFAHFCAVMAADITDGCLQPSQQFGVQRILHVLHGMLEVLPQHKKALAGSGCGHSHGSGPGDRAFDINCIAKRIRGSAHFDLKLLLTELVALLQEVQMRKLPV